MLLDNEKRLSQWINLFQITMLKKQVKVEAPGPATTSSVISGISETTLVEGWVPRMMIDDVSSFWSKKRQVP